MSNPSFAIAVTFEILPEHVDAFRQRVLRQARDSVEREEGCFQFDVLVDQSDPATFFLYETYADEAALAAHRDTPHFADFDATVRPWIVSKSIRRLQLIA